MSRRAMLFFLWIFVGLSLGGCAQVRGRTDLWLLKDERWIVRSEWFFQGGVGRELDRIFIFVGEEGWLPIGSGDGYWECERRLGGRRCLLVGVGEGYELLQFLGFDVKSETPGRFQVFYKGEWFSEIPLAPFSYQVCIHSAPKGGGKICWSGWQDRELEVVPLDDFPLFPLYKWWWFNQWEVGLILVGVVMLIAFIGGLYIWYRGAATEDEDDRWDWEDEWP